VGAALPGCLRLRLFVEWGPRLGKRAAAVAWQVNPLAGSQDLTLEPFRADGAAWGLALGQQAREALAPAAPAAFGKSAVVGARGQVEHALARMVTPFVEAMKEAIGPTRTWSSTSATRSTVPEVLDILLTSTQNLEDRHLTSTFSVPLGHPVGDDQLAVAVALAAAGAGEEREAAAMDLKVRKWCTIVDRILEEGGVAGDPPLIKSCAAAVIKNPYAGGFGDDLSLLIEASGRLGQELGRLAVQNLGGMAPQGYGKAALVGLAGLQEHANACLTTVFGNALREAVGGGKAWIPSNTKRVAPGGSIDVPLAYKDALYVRSHYDTMEVTVPDAPLPDELVVMVVVTNRGRIGARVGGLTVEQVKGEDGLT
jgi:hypothetical protein